MKFASLLERLQAYEPGTEEARLMERVRAVVKILGIFEAWDGIPAHLDLENISTYEMGLAAEDISKHHEADYAKYMQHGNACSLIATANSFQSELLALPRVWRRVTYI